MFPSLWDPWTGGAPYFPVLVTRRGGLPRVESHRLNRAAGAGFPGTSTQLQQIPRTPPRARALSKGGYMSTRAKGKDARTEKWKRRCLDPLPTAIVNAFGVVVKIHGPEETSRDAKRRASRRASALLVCATAVTCGQRGSLCHRGKRHGRICEEAGPRVAIRDTFTVGHVDGGSGEALPPNAAKDVSFALQPAGGISGFERMPALFYLQRNEKGRKRWAGLYFALSTRIRSLAFVQWNIQCLLVR